MRLGRLIKYRNEIGIAILVIIATVLLFTNIDEQMFKIWTNFIIEIIKVASNNLIN